MRKGLAVVACGLCLGWAAPVGAQQQSASFFTGVNPRNINFKPVDTSNFYKTYNLTSVVKPAHPPKAFSLSTIFHPLSMLSWPPQIGQSTYPPTTMTFPTVTVPRSNIVLPQ